MGTVVNSTLEYVILDFVHSLNVENFGDDGMEESASVFKTLSLH